MKKKILLVVTLLMVCMSFALVGDVFARHSNYYEWEYSGNSIIGSWDNWSVYVPTPYGHGYYQTYNWYNNYAQENPIKSGHWFLGIRFGQYADESLRIYPEGVFTIWTTMRDDDNHEAGYGLNVVTNPNNDDAQVYYITLNGEPMFPQYNYTVNLNDYNIIVLFKCRTSPKPLPHNYVFATKLYKELKSNSQLTELEDGFSTGAGGAYAFSANETYYRYGITADYGSTGAKKRFAVDISDWNVGYYADVARQDGKVDIFDLVIMGGAYGATPETVGWQTWWWNNLYWIADIDCDYDIDIYDQAWVMSKCDTEWE